MQAIANLSGYVHALLKDTTDTSAMTAEQVGSYVMKKSDALLAIQDNDTDVEGCFKLLVKVTGSTHAAELIAKLTQNHTNATLKLRILADLFNSLPAQDAQRFNTLVAIINYAGATNQVHLIKSYFNDIDALVSGVAPANLRNVYLSIADLLEKEAEGQQALVFLEKYLKSFENEKDVSSAKPVAIRAALAVIKNPIESFVAHIDLIDLKAVAQLKGSNKLYDLLDIFTSKTLADYLVFEKANAGTFKEYALDSTVCASNMRLLTLCSYPTGQEAIAYASIQQTLQVKEDQVEQWVVKAITANLISAKIDQLGRSVVITRSLQRGFGASEWKALHAKLLSYKANVGSLLETIRQARLHMKSRRMSTLRRGSARLPPTGLHPVHAEDIVIEALDELLNGLIRSMQENALRKATLNYTATIAADCVMGMLGMMMLPYTKSLPLDSVNLNVPTGAPIDIWSKSCLPSKRKSSRRSSISPNTLKRSGTSNSLIPASRAPSPKRINHLPPSDEVDDRIAVQFLSSYVDMMPISLEELERRENIEKILAADAERRKRLEFEEARSRATSTFVTDKEILEKQQKATQHELEHKEEMVEEQIEANVPSVVESEVVLCEDQELLVGENSLLVSRRSKKEVLKKLPPPRLEPTVIVPPPELSSRLLSPPNSLSETRASTRKSMARIKSSIKPKTPQAQRLAPLIFSTPADNAKLFIRYEELNGGPAFDEASSPVSRGVVIKHKGLVKRGVGWKPEDEKLARNESEPVLRRNSKKRPSNKSNAIDPFPIPTNNPTSKSHSALPQPVHHHDEVKSLTMRIRTPACKSRRSRRILDIENYSERSDAMIYEPQKLVLRALKLPQISKDTSDTVLIQNEALTLPLVANSSSLLPSR